MWLWTMWWLYPLQEVSPGGCVESIAKNCMNNWLYWRKYRDHMMFCDCISNWLLLYNNSSCALSHKFFLIIKLWRLRIQARLNREGSSCIVQKQCFWAPVIRLQEQWLQENVPETTLQKENGTEDLCLNEGSFRVCLILRINFPFDALWNSEYSVYITIYEAQYRIDFEPIQWICVDIECTI